MTTYAGIGSRQTPLLVLATMHKFAQNAARAGWTLRSGGATGADQAFQRGAELAGGTRHIYLPTSNIPHWAYDHAKRFHPNWAACERQGMYVMSLHARNSLIVLGEDGESPADYIVCWTAGGRGEGGTGQALRIAKHYNIPIFDLGHPSQLDFTLARILQQEVA